MATTVAVGGGGMTSPWRAMHTIFILCTVVAVVLIGVLTPIAQRLWGWIGIVILLTAFAIVAGNGITGLW